MRIFVKIIKHFKCGYVHTNEVDLKNLIMDKSQVIKICNEIGYGKTIVSLDTIYNFINVRAQLPDNSILLKEIKETYTNKEDYDCALYMFGVLSCAASLVNLINKTK